MKLNLGSGNKLYAAAAGWINIDIEDPKEKYGLDCISLDLIPKNLQFNTDGPPYFHQSMLNDLQFVEDEVADEVHAYHIIEHFYRDEVLDILKEWKRVLKPGGSIFMEQPDIVKCAANFLSGTLNGDQKLQYNLGFLGFYGDGTAEDPLMGHHWGWFPASLSHALFEAGFEDVVEAAPITHMKSVRDFRMEAKKPL